MNVTYLDHMGSDLTVVNAARVSFSKKSDWENGHDPNRFENHLSDKDVKLINYLAREGHELPFRHPHISFHCKAPLFVARQAG